MYAANKVQKNFEGRVMHSWNNTESTMYSDIYSRIQEWIHEDKRSLRGNLNGYKEVDVMSVPYKKHSGNEYKGKVVEKRYFINWMKKQVIEYCIQRVELIDE